MTRTRQPVKALNQSTATVAKAAAAEKARKAASRAALKAAKAAAKQDDVTPPAPLVEAPKAEPTPPVTEVAKPDTRAAWLATQAVDFEALNEGKAAIVDGEQTPEFVAYLAEQGVATDGSVKPLATGYTGPMLALRAAAKTYVTGKNGNPHCNDWMAIALDGLTREEVVAKLGALLLAKGITSTLNPYLGLNPGQQSMNLRNKARGAFNKNLLTMADLATLKA
jgi:hypothetical protein